MTALSASSLLLLGLILGARHATDPDHVAAVATIVAGERSVPRAMRIGALWGLGHSVTILLVGGLIVAFRFAIPPRLGLAAEMLVAVMLIVLGAMALRSHRHPPATAITRPVLVGLVHGLAGSAFVAMLVLGATPHPAIAVAYLAAFGVGTVGGMSLITGGVTIPVLLVAGRSVTVSRYLRMASGVGSIALGLFLVHRVGFVDGLFTSAPSWTPQ